MFKFLCFPKSIILQVVYFNLRFSLSYRDLEELADGNTRSKSRSFNN